MGELNVPKRLLDIAAREGRPDAFSESALRARFGDPSDVEIEPGQVWRGIWGEVAILLVVVTIESRHVLSLPVTIDPPAEDEQSLVLGPELTAFRTPVTVWAGLIRSVPTRVLHTLVDAWSTDLVDYLSKAPETRRPVPAGVRRGHPIESKLDHRAHVRAELEDDLEQLAEAPGLPIEEPGARPVSLAALLGEPDLATLCAALGLPQPAVMRLLRGTATLTSAQIDIVAGVTGVPVDQIAATVRRMPVDLVEAAEHPRWRRAWRKRARRLGVSETEARLDGSYRALGLAARQTGGGRPDWNARLRHVLLDEEGSDS